MVSRLHTMHIILLFCLRRFGAHPCANPSNRIRCGREFASFLSIYMTQYLAIGKPIASHAPTLLFRSLRFVNWSGILMSICLYHKAFCELSSRDRVSITSRDNPHNDSLGPIFGTKVLYPITK